MSESGGHSSLPSYPVLPPSELDKLQDLSSLDSTSLPPSSFNSSQQRTTTVPSSQPPSAGSWFNPTSSSTTGSSSYATGDYSPTTAARYGGHPGVVGVGESAPSSSSSSSSSSSVAAQQHSALHMYNQGARGIVPQSGSPTATPVVPPAPNPTSTSPHLRIHYLEQLCMTLRREKEQLEGEFGRQRKMFMNHMTELENEISLAKQTNKKLSEEVRELSTQLLYRDEELKSVTTASKMAEAQNREAFDVDRVKYEEEIASLRQILDGEREGERERKEMVCMHMTLSYDNHCQPHTKYCAMNIITSYLYAVQRNEHKSALNEEREKWRTEKCALLAEVKVLKGRSLSPLPTTPTLTSGNSNENSRTASPEESLETSMMKVSSQL